MKIKLPNAKPPWDDEPSNETISMKIPLSLKKRIQAIADEGYWSTSKVVYLIVSAAIMEADKAEAENLPHADNLHPHASPNALEQRAVGA